MTQPSLTSDLQRLEEIVRSLESESTDLDQALVLFEEGVARLRSARQYLADAELRIQRVLEDAAGKLRLADFEE